MEDPGKNKKTISRRGLLFGIGATAAGGYGLKAEDWNPQQKTIKLSGPSKPDPEGYFSNPGKAADLLKGHESNGLFFRGATNNLINVGVTHEHARVASHLSFLQSAIKNADLVLLEYDRVGEYFRDIAVYCKNNQLNYDCFDVYRTGSSDLLFGLASDAIFLYGLNKLDVKKLAFGYANGFLVSLNIDMLLKYIESVIGIINDNNLMSRSISYVSGARDVFMSVRLKRVMDENPGKRVLAISGDRHASTIEKYVIGSGGNLELLYSIYRILYGWRSGLYTDPFEDI